MTAIAPLPLTRLIVIAMYLFAMLISYRWLIPRLSATARKLAITFFAVMALATAIALQSPGAESYVQKMFHLSREHNIATALAGTLLAFVGQVALLTALLMRGRPPWRRVHLLGFGLLFLFFSWDELFLVHEGIAHSEYIYAAFGALVAALTAWVMIRSPRRTWIFYLCLLAGLLIGAVGALWVDAIGYGPICGEHGLVIAVPHLERPLCLVYLIEETFELLGVWLVLIAVLGLLSDVVGRPTRRLRGLLYLLPAISFIVIVVSSDPDLQKIQWRIQALPTDVTFESGVQLYGYQLAPSAEEDNLQVSLWFSALPFGYDGLGYSIHLLDPITATPVASRDEFVSVSGSRVRGRWHLPVFRQALQLDLPAEVPRNRALWVVLTAWRAAADQFAPLNVFASDRGLLTDTQVVLGEFVIPAESFALETAPFARFDNAITLGAVDLPTSARPGETLAIAFNWRAEDEVAEDYVQFLHFGDEATGEWWVYDQAPLGARLPTRLWYGGLADSEVWMAPLRADLAPGRYLVFTGLYRASDQERLPARDVAGAPFPDARVPLGVLTLE